MPSPSLSACALGGGWGNFGVDVYQANDAKVTGVTIRGSFSDAVQVFDSQGIARGKPIADTFGKAALLCKKSPENNTREGSIFF